MKPQSLKSSKNTNRFLNGGHYHIIATLFYILADTFPPEITNATARAEGHGTVVIGNITQYDVVQGETTGWNIAPLSAGWYLFIFEGFPYCPSPSQPKYTSIMVYLR